MNEAVKEGCKILVKKVESSNKVKGKYALIKDRKTGEIIRLGDYRAMMRRDEGDFEILIDWTYYYPYRFENPFAAYLIPPDIKKRKKFLLKM
ncbi:hypothetical protein [Robertkochia aurantiaca]|uniref:hypothetical protein n=1 Tax=Robertkochia aurantiaca TaxID=2873700 RepID=UPI001CCC9FE7|nr:hypothetical protein [Robertkochia sp. 3YJGBD-33]